MKKVSSQLSLAEAFARLRKTFEDNERQFPDVMEPYSVRLGGASNDQEATAIMRAGLRETIDRRYPRRLAALIKAGVA